MWLISAFADEISPDPLVQTETLHSLGVKGLELRSSKGVNVADLAEAEVLELKTLCERFGIQPTGVGSPVNKVELDPALHEQEIDKLRRSIRAAKWLGVSNIRVFTPVALDDSWPEVRQWMRPMVDLAESEGVTLLHENDSDFFGSRPLNAQKLLSEFGGNSFCAVYDFANATLWGFEAQRDWFPWLLPHLKCLHIKDADPETETILPAGSGKSGIQTTFRYLKESGWSGVVALEPHLSAAGPYGGFSGPELFGVAARALFDLLDAEHIAR